MTTVTLTKIDNRIATVEISGHTDFGVEGEDIVCAALSAITQTALLGLLSVVGINVDYKKKDEEGYLYFGLPKKLTEKQANDAEVILLTMLAGVSDLAGGYSDFIKLEVK